MKRAPGIKVPCDVCGKMVFQRGLKSHLRLQHNLKVREITKVLETTPTQVKIKPQNSSKSKNITHQVVTRQVVETKRIYESCPHSDFLGRLNWHVDRGHNYMPVGDQLSAYAAELAEKLTKIEKKNSGKNSSK